ncbi:MAG: hypothetical protein ACLQGP_04670 [Isosphaeraceae bacterium]
MVQRLAAVVSELGRRTAGDATTLATTLARTGRNEGKTLGGTRLSPIAKALDEQIRQEQSATGDE